MIKRNTVWTRRAVGTFVFCSLLGGTPLWAETFPQRGVEIVNALYAGTDPQNDDARRIAIRRTCEQMSFELGARWGGKKRTGLPDTFRSPDSIAFLEADQTVSVWDVQASSGQILVHTGKSADHPNLSPNEAAFMPCDAINHLGAGPAPGPGPVPPPIDSEAIELLIGIVGDFQQQNNARLDRLEQQLAAHDKKVDEFREEARGWVSAMKDWRTYLFGGGLAAIVQLLRVQEPQ